MGYDSNHKNIRVYGCVLGLDSDDPKLPKRICHNPCQWRVNHRKSNNCSWVLFDILFLKKESLTLREIGTILGTTHETVRHAEISALRKLRLIADNMEKFSEFDFKTIDADSRSSKQEQSEKDREIIELLSNLMENIDVKDSE